MGLENAGVFGKGRSQGASQSMRSRFMRSCYRGSLRHPRQLPLSTSRAALVVRWTEANPGTLAEILPVITVFAAFSLAPPPAAPMSRRLRRLWFSRRALLRHLTLRRNPGSRPFAAQILFYRARSSDQPLIAPSLPGFPGSLK